MESQEFIENWRAHVSNYKKLKKNNKFTPEQYCKNEGIDLSAFCFWQNYINQEDKFTYYRSFAPAYLKQAKTVLELLDHYIDIDPRLRMPLMRDAIISYAALFRSSNSRVFNKSKWYLKEQTFVPQHLQDIHRKICEDRDSIIAHCDLNPRNPKVTQVGIVLKGKGFYWEDYKALIPQFKELIEAVMNSLKPYVAQENLSSAEKAFQHFNPPSEALKDPGKPKNTHVLL
jgi:predicted nucleic acid-binding Zn ribbon protein